MILSVLILCLAIQILLSIKQVNPFISLLLVSVLAGLLLGMEGEALLTSFEKGVSSTLGNIALILCLGAALGKLLEKSGAANRITNSLLRSFGEKYSSWAILFSGFLIGIPLYYNAGFIILVPLIFSLARTSKLPILYLAIPMAASLSITHCFLPPHPGPVYLVGAFHAHLGKTLWLGLILAIPCAVVAGPLLGKYFRSFSPALLQEENPMELKTLPSIGISLLAAFLPVLLILLSVITKALEPNNHIVVRVVYFLGQLVCALLLSILLSFYLLGIRKGKSLKELSGWVNEGIAGIAMILMIITAGGIFRQVLLDSGSADYIASWYRHWQMPPLLFGWLITALLRVCLGSATIAGITASGMVLPLVVANACSPELMVLAVGAGSVFGSHINDTGFWMFKEFFNLSLKETFLSWTLMESLISVLGLSGVLILDVFL